MRGHFYNSCPLLIPKHAECTFTDLSNNGITERLKNCGGSLKATDGHFLDMGYTVEETRKYLEMNHKISELLKGGGLNEESFKGPLTTRNELTKKWISRMSKFMVVFSLLVTQDEQTPFTYSDGWAWLSNMLNSCARNPPREYTGYMIEIFLRVSWEKLSRHFGESFLELVR